MECCLEGDPCQCVQLCVAVVNWGSTVLSCWVRLMLSQICLLCRTLGTPTEANWPGVTELPDYKPTFPKWAPKSLKSLLPKLPDTGLDLLKVCTPCRLKRTYTGNTQWFTVQEGCSRAINMLTSSIAT